MVLPVLLVPQELRVLLVLLDRLALQAQQVLRGLTVLWEQLGLLVLLVPLVLQVLRELMVLWVQPELPVLRVLLVPRVLLV